jgi:hypothetical protein
MIRDTLHSATLKAVRYDPVTEELFVEFTAGNVLRYAPVPYRIYRAITSSRFPERTYRHLIRDRALPEAAVE